MKLPILILPLFIFSITINAQVDPINKEGVAIGGYDVVSYFTSKQPVKGNKQFLTVHNGATYFFSSEGNQKLFEENPSKYLPQFDGYCALSVSYGKKISIDPETYKVANNKLYLFYNGDTSQGTVNTLHTWNKNEDRLLKKANANWPEVKKLKYSSVNSKFVPD